MTNNLISFIKTNQERILIISGVLFCLLTILFIVLITSSTLQNLLGANNINSITPETYSLLMLLFFVILNIYCILFVLFVIYTTTSSNSVKLGNPDYWLFTSSLILTCLIVYDLFLSFILKIIVLYQNKTLNFSEIEVEFITKLVPIVKVLIPVLILIKLIVGLSAISLYLYNFVENGGTFYLKTVFISIISLLITIMMNKLFIVAFKMGSGALSENKLVYGLLCLLLLLIVYLIVLDIVNNRKELSGSYYIVAIALLLTFILALFIFFIYSIFFKKSSGGGGGHDGGGGDGGGGGHDGGGGYIPLDPNDPDYSNRDYSNRDSLSTITKSSFSDDKGDLTGFYVRQP
jgi:hypothetical protein